MKKTLLAVALASSLTSVGALAADKAPEPNFSISGNFGLVNDYKYRGISQSGGNAAVSGGLDLTHKSGFYLGTWNSSISWLSSSSSSGLETDVYAGYRFEAAGVGVDIGDLYYYYPGDTSGAKTNEVYIGLSYGPVSFKTSYATTSLFGTTGQSGSLYYDLTLSHALTERVSAKVHVGYNDLKGGSSGYDYLAGFSVDMGGGYALGLNYVATSGDYKTLADSDSKALISLTKTF